MQKVQITDTILRDAHQSLIATRMRTEDMLPAAADLDAVGYFSLEVWGGATFDVCLRFLNEDPWERLRTLRKALPNTRLQMLLRGQNCVGYRHYADDVVEAFVATARENGIDVFRIFDALNDIRNLAPAMHAAKKVDALVEGSISYTISPVHTTAQFVEFAKSLKDEGADIICIKDMAGLGSPERMYELISALKADVGLPVHLHAHSASGMVPATYLRAAQAGVDILDCALSPFSWGTAQPPTESIAAIFDEGGYTTGLDKDALFRAADHFTKVRETYKPLLKSRSERVDTGILKHQIPGGMLSNLLSQLEMQGAGDKLDEVLEETVRVRKDLGYPPLVTPTSQIVGTQAVFNVVAGERYKMVSAEVKDYVRGKYGRPPGQVDPNVKQIAIGDEEPITTRPAADFLPELDGAREAVAEYSDRIEDALSYAMFPAVALAFLKARAEGKAPDTTEPRPEELRPQASKAAVEKADGEGYRATLGGKEYEASVERTTDADGTPGFAVVVDGERFEVALRRAARKRGAGSASNAVASGDAVTAPMPGTVVKVEVAAGDEVEEGQVVAILEAMKMQNELKAPRAGKVAEILVAEGGRVDLGTVIVAFEKA